jgi:K+ transporter
MARKWLELANEHKFFDLMQRNAVAATKYFHIRPNRVTEFGRQVEI